MSPLGLTGLGAVLALGAGEPPRIDGVRVAIGMVLLAAVGLAACGLFGLAGLGAVLTVGAGVATGGGRRLA